MSATSHTKKDYQTLVEIAQVLVDLGVLDHDSHSRWRVYPQDVTQAVTLTAGTPANTFGSWALVIPVDTIPFAYGVIGFCVCSVSAATNYHIQLGYNPVNAVPGANMELGERRFRIATTPIARQSELMEIRSQGIPANGSVWGRMKTATGAADNATINVVVKRILDVSRTVAEWPAFPW